MLTIEDKRRIKDRITNSPKCEIIRVGKGHIIVNVGNSPLKTDFISSHKIRSTDVK